VFVVDAADRSTIETAKRELHSLVTKRPLAKIPLLVLGNKNDLKDALTAQEMISVFELDTIDDREVFCYSISAKNHDNVDKTMDWLIRHAKKRS
jgi:ADP-ribosylation factor-like protein 8